MKYRKKPVVIEAMQWDGYPESTQEIIDWNPEINYQNIPISTSKYNREYEPALFIPTMEGMMKASVGDWIIKGVAGEFYPCKPDIFDKTYEKVDE